MTSPQLDTSVQIIPNSGSGDWTEMMLEAAIKALKAGYPVIVPTETVYGLAADASNTQAVDRIYTAKGRPSNNPLICHVDSLAMARSIADFSPLSIQLAKAFWPGPLTLVAPVKKEAQLSERVTAGLDTVAIRCPAKKVMRQLITAVGRPLAAPSANQSGKLSPVTADAAVASLNGKVGIAIDDGRAQLGLESTIVCEENSGLTILRPGGITLEALSEVADVPVKLAMLSKAPATLTAPGQMDSHYAPGKPVRLNITSRTKGHILIGFGSIQGDLSLSPTGDPSEAAFKLYDLLANADRMAGHTIDIAPIPAGGLGDAINDRLRRAAAPRETS